MNALTLIISTAFQELRQPLTKLFALSLGGNVVLNSNSYMSAIYCDSFRWRIIVLSPFKSIIFYERRQAKL